MKQLFFIFYFFLSLMLTHAGNIPFQAGEALTFDIHYKYGLVMLKAGTANYSIKAADSKAKSVYHSELNFKTSSFFDKIFKMRDTLRSTITEDLIPLYNMRSVNEGNYQFTEEMFFKKATPNYSEVRVKRESHQLISFDTILIANRMCYDILNLVFFIRSLDYSQWSSTQEKTVSTFVGRDKVVITVRSEGQSVVEKNDTLKYKTYKIALDFTDRVFNESKNAVEIWLSDDENRIPVKIRAKLRIGAAEVYLTSWKNLKYPLSSEIRIPVRKE
jgi:hypothetical protein